MTLAREILGDILATISAFEGVGFIMAALFLVSVLAASN